MLTESRAQGGQRSAVLAQVVVHNCMHSDILVRHGALNSEEYAAVLSVLLREFENRIIE